MSKRTLMLLAGVGIAGCTGELGEKLGGVEIVSYDCADILDDGVPVDGRYPMAMFCAEGSCWWDLGYMEGEHHWFSPHCEDYGSALMSRLVVVALIPFAPEEYALDTELVKGGSGVPLLMYCVDSEGSPTCHPNLGITDENGDTTPSFSASHDGYLLVDWSKAGSKSVVPIEDVGAGIEVQGDVPVVYSCSDASSMKNCQPDWEWTIVGEQLHPLVRDEAATELMIRWL